jgi:hypothetical protein
MNHPLGDSTASLPTDVFVFVDAYCAIAAESNLVQKMWEVKCTRSHRYSFLIPLVSLKSNEMDHPKTGANEQAPVVHVVRHPVTNRLSRVVFECAHGACVVVSVRLGRHQKVLFISALLMLEKVAPLSSVSRSSAYTRIDIELMLAQSAWCHTRGSGSTLMRAVIAWLSGIRKSTDTVFWFWTKLECMPRQNIRLGVFALRDAVPFYLKMGFRFNCESSAHLDLATPGSCMSLWITHPVNSV